MAVIASEQPLAEVSSKKAISAKKGLARRILQMVLTTLGFVTSLFLAAGTVRWLRGWICVALWFSIMPAMAIVTERYSPGLMQERMRWRRKDTKPFDKIFLAIYIPMVMIQPAVGGLDTVRFRWSSLPFFCVYAGAVIFAAGMALVAWVLMTNPFAESSVRIQNDRGQKVISSGPYRFVRHPMYVGAILMYPAQALVLGSIWALVLSGVIALLMIARTALEDRTLRRELAGYDEYATQTRYRLLPGIW